MSATTDFYLMQADKCATEAAGTVLEQVRERNLRAERAWRAMADRLIQTEEARNRRTEAAA